MRKEKKKRKEKKDFSVGFEESARYKFLESLSVVMPTPNHEDFFFVFDDVFKTEKKAVGVVTIDVMHNHQLGLEWSIYNAVHIRSLGVANDERGIGYFSCLCSLLIRVAEEAGVFLYGTALPFRYDIPTIVDKDGIEEFLKKRDSSWYSMKTDKKIKQQSLELRKAYLRNGFCAYDSSGFAGNDRFFKKTGFGYLSTKTNVNGLQGYFDRHLSCC